MNTPMRIMYAIRRIDTGHYVPVSESGWRTRPNATPRLFKNKGEIAKSYAGMEYYIPDPALYEVVEVAAYYSETTIPMQEVLGHV